MSILFRKLLRDIRETKGQFISILIIVILGVMFYSGINSTFRNLSDASTKYYSDYRFADIWVDLYKAPQGVMEKVDALPYVKEATGRIVEDTGINIDNENATVRFITLPDVKKDIVNDIVIKSGRYFSPDENNQCLVEEGFFTAHNLKEGDYIYPIVNGNKVKLKVIGSVKSPEFIYALKDGSELIPDNDKFGIIYVKDSFGQSILHFNGSINNISIELSNNANVEDAKDNIKRVLKNFGVTNVTDREDQLSAKMLSQEIKQLKSMGSSFPVIFFIVAAVIIYIMMGRMVENQRTQIGVLKAMGFTNLQLLMHYLSYSIVVAVTGSILGSIFGMYLGVGFTNLENMYFKLPLTAMKMYGDLILPASLITLFFCLLAGYNSCKTVFKIMPSESMRAKAPAIGKKILLERVGVIWKSIGHTWKIILRNVFRNKRRTLMTSIGIIFCTAILLVALGMEDSINSMVDKQYGNIQNYDIKVNFSKLQNVQQLIDIKNIPHVVKIEPVLETGVEITNGWRKKTVGLTALVKDPEMYKVIDIEGNDVSLPQSGILVPQKMAEELGIKPYDKVYIKSLLPDKEKKEIQVNGIIQEYMGSSVYSGLNSVNYLLGEGTVANSAVLKLDSSTSEKEVKDKLEGMPGVISIQSKAESMNVFLKTMQAMYSEIGVMIALSAVLAIAVVYNITTINIFERQRELATLKVLGFKDGEVKKLIFNENYMITLFGIALGLPLGKWLGVVLMKASSTDTMDLPFVVNFRSYLIAAVLTIIFTTLANFVLMKKIRTINMVEVLKSIE